MDPDDLDLLGPGWTPPRRVGRLTVLLAAGLVAALGFAGGVLVQKNHDAGLSGRTSAAGRSFVRGNGPGSGAGGAGGAGAERGFGGARPGTTSGPAGAAGAGPESGPGVGPGAGPGSGPGGPASPGPGADAGTPVVVGTVASVAPGTLVVRNFAGRTVTVKVPAGTPVTTPGLTGLRAGMTVSVAGAKAADGTVTATSVVSRGHG